MNDVKVILDTSALSKMDQKIARALALTGKVLQDDIREEMVVPRAEGTLQGEAFYVDDKKADKGIVSLRFSTPYARRLYYHPEYNFRQDKNPNAQGMWLVHWLKGGKHQERPKKIFVEILKRGI